MKNFDVVIIGGGPAGLAAAISAKRAGAKVLLIEREARLGGILKQCIHDGFGLVRFKQKLTGPEYAERFIKEFTDENIEALKLTFVTKIEKQNNIFLLSAVNKNGLLQIDTKTLILATGCRERTAKQVFIHGTRPSGVFTAGCAQHYINIFGQMPSKKCVILGSGDIGLIMARRLTLEGAKVIGVYEAKQTPSGLTRNIHQCLNDYDIPLFLSKTVTRVFGNERLTAVEVCSVDEEMKPIIGTEEKIECDSLILSVGLIPENELAESLGVAIDAATKGPICNENLMTSVPGVFSCGNALHVNDLVDYVSESGETAGRAAAAYIEENSEKIILRAGEGLAYVVPQRLNSNMPEPKTVAYFRSKKVFNKCELIVETEKNELIRKRYSFLRPPEMERLEISFSDFNLEPQSKICFRIEES